MKDFSVFAAIKHLNIRKQGEEQEVLAVDVKLEGRVEAWLVDDLMCEGLNEGACVHSFWLRSEDKAPSFPQLSEIGFDREYKNLRVEVLGLELNGVTIKKFRFVPVAGELAELTFQMSVTEPPPKTVDLLASQLTASTWFKFFATQGDLPLHDKGDGKPIEIPPAATDDLAYMQAVDIVRSAGVVSVSKVQRSLKIGYNAAARLIERMEAEGIVGPAGPGGNREILKEASNVQ